MLGNPNLNVGDTEAPVGKAPLHTPDIVGTDARVIDNPSLATLIILLNLSIVSPGN